MCGIIAYTGTQPVMPILRDGLKRLEYRGYDSSGVSVISRKKLKTTKTAGKLDQLESKVDTSIDSHCGIGHTRWATHGAPTDENAHPHTDTTSRYAIVHNGIIENIEALKATLPKGTKYTSETDSEVIAHLLVQNDGELIDAVQAVLKQVIGTYGLAVIDNQYPNTIAVSYTHLTLPTKRIV